MNKNINVLITSVGRRTKLIEYFKEELEGRGNVITTDCSCLAPGLYASDKYYIVPRIDDPEYIKIIKNICQKEKIEAIISLIDPELSLIAKNKQEFNEIGVTNIVSSYEVCELFLDKYKTFKFCKENKFNCAKTYNDFDLFKKDFINKKIKFPVFIKPQKGSASLNINKAENMEQAKLLFGSSEDMIIQEYLDGQELGIDVYVDMISKEVISIFIKEKVVMRSGETDKSKSIINGYLFELINEFVTKAKLLGPIDIDVFCVDGKYYISEVNPRFGGGYLHAYECGINFPKKIINNLLGKKNKIEIGNYKENTYMLKHDILTFKKSI